MVWVKVGSNGIKERALALSLFLVCRQRATARKKSTSLLPYPLFLSILPVYFSKRLTSFAFIYPPPQSILAEGRKISREGKR